MTENTTRLRRRSVLKGIGAIGAGAIATSRGSRAVGRLQQAGSVLPGVEELESFFDGLMAAHLEAHDIAGATLSVVADGEVRLAKGYGRADVAADRPVVADETLFRVGSVAKLVTCTAVMDGVERGELDLDTDVNGYLEDISIPETYSEPITLEHLGTHTAGFEERLGGTFARDAGDLRPLGAVLADEMPARVRPPGELASYSNYGMSLAGYVAAAQAGSSSFEEHVRERVFDPLGMDRSTFVQPPPDDLADRLATGYTVEGDSLREGDFEYVASRPAGAMSATATDMATFMLAHLRGGRAGPERVLGPETVRAMHDRRFSNHPAVNGMGYGFYEMSRKGVRIVGHGGDTSLFHSLLALLPEHDVGVFVSYNSPGGVDAREELLDAFLEEFVPTEERPIERTGSPSRPDDVEGWYRTTRIPETTVEKLAGGSSVVSVEVAADGTLVTTLGGSETKRWVEVEPLVFRELDGDDTLAFREDGAGRITHLFFGSVPVSGFERLAQRETPPVQVGVFAVSALLLLSGTVGWSATGLYHRIQGRPPGDERPRIARWSAGTAGACFLAFVLGVVGLVVTDPLSLVYGIPSALRLLLVLPIVGAIATLGALALAVQSWRAGYWGPLKRVHYTLVVLAALAFCWLLYYWNLLGFRF